MKFQPIKQLNTIVQQEYLEPTLSWSIRVVLALNVPLIVLPLYVGMKYEIIWAAFAAYLVTMVDYRGPHFRKMVIQIVEGILIYIAGIIGLLFGDSITLAVIGMAIIGMLAALIRNWSNYGSSIGVGVGFFYLFGLTQSCDFHEALIIGNYIWIGVLWAAALILISFPFTAVKPLKRSISLIWNANTDYLDALVNYFGTETETTSEVEITKKELAIREAIDKSIEFFERQNNAKIKTEHYDQMMEIRRHSALFGGVLKALHHEVHTLNLISNSTKRYSIVYKTLSALSQVSARIAILNFTLRADDLMIAKTRQQRFAVAITILDKATSDNNFSDAELTALRHIKHILDEANSLIVEVLEMIEGSHNNKQQLYFENYKLSLNQFILGLKPRKIGVLIKDIFNFNSQQFNYSVRVAIGMAFSVFIFKFFKIDHGHWIALTMLIVIQPYYGATKKKGVERIVGTLLGIVIGGFIMLLPIPHYYFTYILIFISFFVAYFLRNNYKIGVLFVTIMMVILMQMTQQTSWALIGWRLISTSLGAGLALLISSMFWPVWENQRFPALIKKALLNNGTYFKQVISQHIKKTNPPTWMRNRRLTEAANNDVFACIQRMYEEPEFARNKVDSSFAQVGACIRLTREINSLTFMLQHTDTEIISKELDMLSNLIELIGSQLAFMEIAEAQETLKLIKELLKEPGFKGTEELKEMKVELEKITFEFETIHALKSN
jgi:uncharacterized membrane protein YccC